MYFVGTKATLQATPKNWFFLFFFSFSEEPANIVPPCAYFIVSNWKIRAIFQRMLVEGWRWRWKWWEMRWFLLWMIVHIILNVIVYIFTCKLMHYPTKRFVTWFTFCCLLLLCKFSKFHVITLTEWHTTTTTSTENAVQLCSHAACLLF